MLNKLTQFSNASVFGRLLRLPLRCVPAGLALPILSGINRGMSWITGSATHGSWLGTYETDKQACLASLLKPGMVFFDVGANAGFYTLAAARLVGETGRVFAFEPLAENVTNLRKHIQLNALRNTAIVQAAVADENTLSGFDVAPSKAMGALGVNGDYWVPTVSLDHALAHFGFPGPDVIKLDVEGAESRVLKGAATLLAAGKAVWLIALHGDAQRSLCMEILSSYHYRLTHLNGDALSPHDRAVDEIVAFPAVTA